MTASTAPVALLRPASQMAGVLCTAAEMGRDPPAVRLIWVQSNAPTGGLANGGADVAVVRRPLADHRFASTLIGTEFRLVQGVDEWLTFISTGQAIGISSEATAAQNPRPGITNRPVRDVWARAADV